LPCTALIASIAGAIWYHGNREALKSAPAMYSGLVKVGLVVGFGQSVLELLAMMVYSALH
jgi:hypothetical protein